MHVLYWILINRQIDLNSLSYLRPRCCRLTSANMGHGFHNLTLFYALSLSLQEFWGSAKSFKS